MLKSCENDNKAVTCIYAFIALLQAWSTW